MTTDVQQQLIERILSRHYGAAATTAASNTFIHSLTVIFNLQTLLNQISSKSILQSTVKSCSHQVQMPQSIIMSQHLENWLHTKTCKRNQRDHQSIKQYLQIPRQNECKQKKQAGSRRGSRCPMLCTYTPSIKLVWKKNCSVYQSYQSIQAMLTQCDVGCIIEKVLIS